MTEQSKIPTPLMKIRAQPTCSPAKPHSQRAQPIRWYLFCILINNKKNGANFFLHFCQDCVYCKQVLLKTNQGGRVQVSCLYSGAFFIQKKQGKEEIMATICKIYNKKVIEQVLHHATEGWYSPWVVESEGEEIVINYLKKHAPRSWERVKKETNALVPSYGERVEMEIRGTEGYYGTDILGRKYIAICRYPDKPQFGRPQFGR